MFNLYDQIRDTDLRQEANIEVLDNNIIDRNNLHISKIRDQVAFLQNKMFSDREKRIWGLEDKRDTEPYATRPEFQTMNYRQIVAFKTEQ